MTTNKPKVQRYDNMGCPEEICRVDTMHESDDGYYVEWEAYEALQAECEKLRRDAAGLVEALEQVIKAAPSGGPLWHGSEQIVEARAALAAREAVRQIEAFAK